MLASCLILLLYYSVMATRIKLLKFYVHLHDVYAAWSSDFCVHIVFL